MYLKIFLISVILSLLILPLRGGYFSFNGLTPIQMSMVAHLLAFFLITAFFLKKNKGLKPLWVVGAIIMGSSILEAPLHIIAWKETFHTFIDMICRWFAILTGYLYWRFSQHKKFKILVITLYLVICI